MPRIANIPEAMIEEHIDWHHHVHHRASRPGEEFLVWHHGYLGRFHDWVERLPENEKPGAAAISPWSAIPEELKEADLGWTSRLGRAEARIEAMQGFRSLDELGDYIDSTVHPWLHHASATAWSEPVLTTFESPRSTYFWQLHGLIDEWRARFAHTP